MRLNRVTTISLFFGGLILLLFLVRPRMGENFKFNSQHRSQITHSASNSAAIKNPVLANDNGAKDNIEEINKKTREEADWRLRQTQILSSQFDKIAKNNPGQNPVEVWIRDSDQYKKIIQSLGNDEAARLVAFYSVTKNSPYPMSDYATPYGAQVGMYFKQHPDSATKLAAKIENLYIDKIPHEFFVSFAQKLRPKSEK